jgi:quercetin dioxygenase-like cupin family protein
MSSNITLIRRAEIPLITEVVEDGERRELGEVRAFRSHPLLAEFIPDDGSRIALAWVRLGPNQETKPHRHPIASLVMCTAGRGMIVDRPEPIIEPGDILLLPAGSTHGFKGLPPTGVEGISIQFEGGLYDDMANPKIQFVRSGGGQ